MAESTLSLTYDDLRRELGRFLGWGRHPSGDGSLQGWEADDVIDCEDILKAAGRLIYSAHRWSFLFPINTFTTSASYATGTVAIAAGVVTLTGGTFPSWAADGEITVLGVTYTVNTRDGNTQVTLDDLTVTVAGPQTFSISRPAYTLPDDFGTLQGPLTYRPGASYHYPPIEIVGESQIRTIRQQGEWTGHPRVAALRPRVHTPTTGQRWELVLYPAPDADYVLYHRYGVNPDKLTPTNKYPHGGMKYGELWTAAVLYAGEQRFRDRSEWQWKEEFEQRLARAIATDEQDAAPDFLGYNGDRSAFAGGCRDAPYDWASRFVTFEGQLYS